MIVYHYQSLLDELQLGDELLLLHLQLVQPGGGLDSVRLQQVGLLHEVELELLLQLRHKLLQLLPPALQLATLLHQLLKLPHQPLESTGIFWK